MLGAFELHAVTAPGCNALVLSSVESFSADQSGLYMLSRPPFIQIEGSGSGCVGPESL